MTPKPIPLLLLEFRSVILKCVPQCLLTTHGLKKIPGEYSTQTLSTSWKILIVLPMPP
uniref:Uncharacterized protein n=1 Tax=Siphoviridae sp. ctTnV63 TaxID=2825523 RepID=A0A8S5NWF0_9CAUD|nr:MAG TPA: hypothetical protein [Siphoviridae sp. ctTnV63]